MSIKSRILDGWGSGIFARITKEGAFNVVVHNHPATDETRFGLPFREYFTNAGSNDMTVDGSTNVQKFSVSATNDFDVFVKYISIEIGDTGSPALNKFGDLAELSNGVKWTWDTQILGDYTLHEGITTNKGFIRIGGDTAAIGTGTNAFLADVSGGQSEKSYLPNIDMAETFALPYGLRLRKGTTDKITFTVQDDLQTLVTFNAIAHGTRI